MTETTANGKTVYSRAVLVIYDGNIVAEKYAPGFDKSTVMLSWSIPRLVSVGPMVISIDCILSNGIAACRIWCRAEEKRNC